MKASVKSIAVAAVLGLAFTSAAFAGKKDMAKKKKACTAKAAAIAGYTPAKGKKPTNAKKAQKFAQQYNKCMNSSGKSLVKVPGL